MPANVQEADTFFGATDATGAEMEELTDGSTTTLHTHAKNHYTGTFTRTTVEGTGNEVITGVGFTPSLIKVSYTAGDGSNGGYTGSGSAHGTGNEQSTYLYAEPTIATNVNLSTTNIITAGAWVGNLTAIGADGFTVNFTGAGSATLNVVFEIWG